ncbi:hypothetical protein SISNIDRAFT_536438 [Sistotremastrum niveocremeum HHB9708]|uniref:Uncharacterized protein n=1 Tax=Sistotremastrum niveocremeum HHB9708 TaxID=1314777 RepID=A0A164XRJ4_9AGAM|nr:hypothetical protein SISNIDRAFT_536438 [Sistotremastrum niveocremeum HHB9708]
MDSVQRNGRLIERFTSDGSAASPRPAGTPLYDAPVYLHESVFRSDDILIVIRCPDAWIFEDENGDETMDIPVFGPNDLVGGMVSLGPGLCKVKGRLVISIEGTFTLISPHLPKPEDPDLPQPLRHVHTFFFGSMGIAVYPREPKRSVILSPREHSPPRESFGARLRKAIILEKIPRRFGTFHKTKSTPVVDSLVKVEPSTWQEHSFSFPLPTTSDKQMPPSFSSSSLVTGHGIRARAYAENAEVSFKVVATWHSEEQPELTRELGAPFLYQPVQDDLPADFPPQETPTTGEWADITLEPVDAERKVPFGCVVTIPHPCSYPRTGNLPFWIVFATKPMYGFLASDIRREATISVSLVRHITFDPSRNTPCTPSPPLSTPADPPPIIQRPARARTQTFLQRVATPILSRRQRAMSDPPEPIAERPKYVEAEKQLPLLPVEAIIRESRKVMFDVMVGFDKNPALKDKKRERRKSKSNRHSRRSSVRSQESERADEGEVMELKPGQPEGVVRGRLKLDGGMLFSIDWPGLTVEYDLEVEIKYDSDHLMARVPVTITSDPLISETT